MLDLITMERLEQARLLLADGGVMVLSFDAMRMFIAGHMSHCIEDVVGERPRAFRIALNVRGWGGTVLSLRITRQSTHKSPRPLDSPP